MMIIVYGLLNDVKGNSTDPRHTNNLCEQKLSKRTLDNLLFTGLVWSIVLSRGVLFQSLKAT